MKLELRNCLIISAVLAVWSGHPLVAGYTYTRVDYPGQSSTVWRAVNNNGAVAGFTGSAFLPQIGILANLNGQTGASFSVGSLFTYALGVDNSGQVIGRSSNWPGNIFLRSPSGTITPLPLPSGVAGAASAAISGNGRIAVSVNNSLYFRVGASYTQFVVPGAGGAGNAVTLTGIDDLGNVVGYYYPDFGAATSFYRDLNGNYQSIYVPGSVYTEVNGMNNVGQAVGFYHDGTRFHGFLWLGGADFVQLEYPGANSTLAEGINDAGAIVGFYYDANSIAHGFFATPPPAPAVPALSDWGLVLLSILLTAATALALARRPKRQIAR